MAACARRRARGSSRGSAIQRPNRTRRTPARLGVREDAHHASMQSGGFGIGQPLTDRCARPRFRTDQPRLPEPPAGLLTWNIAPINTTRSDRGRCLRFGRCLQSQPEARVLAPTVGRATEPGPSQKPHAPVRGCPRCRAVPEARAGIGIEQRLNQTDRSYCAAKREGRRSQPQGADQPCPDSALQRRRLIRAMLRIDSSDAAPIDSSDVLRIDSGDVAVGSPRFRTAPSAIAGVAGSQQRPDWGA